MYDPIYREFLEFFEIKGEMLEKAYPDWIKACERLEVTPEDLRFSIYEWIPRHYQIQYKGLRMVMGAIILEAIDHTKLPEYKAAGVKLVYGVLPANIVTYLSLKMAGGDKIFVSFPDCLMMMFNQIFFARGGKYFEVAEQAGMTYGARHCALNKMRVGIRLAHVVPTPDVDWAWGTVCDEATKIDEYINCLYDEEWKTVITRIPHDTSKGENQWEMDQYVKLYAKELKRSMEEVEEIVGFKVEDEHMAAAIKVMNDAMVKTTQIMMAVTQANPQPLSGSTLLLLGTPKTFPFNTGFDFYSAGVDLLFEELQADIAAGIGVYPKDAPKVAFYFLPWALPWLDTLFRENGVATGASMTTSPSVRVMTPSKYTDPYEQTAESWLKSNYTLGCHVETADWIAKVKMLKPDAYVSGFLDYDRWIGTLHKQMTREVEKACGIPSFYIEGDWYDHRDYSEEALRTRIESICQIIKADKKARMLAAEQNA